ncbi:GIY-YIG nuclease family protein [Shewanella halifaxensis]|uniref:GIY-YIG nuclease family protein n=1 Tax=Shewanella halifaxensis TaxID=271098 RepID=UPI000D59BC4C|nr:GIY-YIG nuclease family protein [Shewanella halifaxensis]
MSPQVSVLFILCCLFAIFALICFIFSQSSRHKKAFEELIQKVAPLWKYQEIEDAHQEAETIKQQAKSLLESAQRDSENLINQVKEDIEHLKKNAHSWAEQHKNKSIIESDQIKLDSLKILEQAKNDAKTQRQELKEKKEVALIKSEEITNQAHLTATQIIKQAEESARVIAGDALTAKNNADTYTAIATAMKNAISGYGDEYIIPNHDAIDILAEEFSHKEAGQRLIDCRKATKSMVLAGKAAECDYVEANRRNTAIHFVLDAFNGKVDSIISLSKRGNFGKLKQQTIDSFSIVNLHGAAFRNARITDLYLQARINELKWSVATEELRRAEKAEQAEIKAQIREEDRARKEYEKAQKEALREEALLEKAIQKAKKELEQASEIERLKLEKQIKELQSKWEEAEAKNQRALSMAQQTKCGHVYIISNIGSFGENIYKVGMTRRLEPMDRVRELGDASVPFSFDVHAMMYSEDAPKLESELHKKFNDRRVNKVNLRKEFFNVTLTELKNLITELGIETHWTMKAEAIQYKESLILKTEQKVELQTVNA